MDKATPSSSWDWDRFIQACIADGVPEHSLRWYVLRIERYLQAHAGTRPTEHSAEQVAAYVASAGRHPGLRGWQFRQIVHALQIFFAHVLRLPWASAFDWAYWIASAKELERKHATLARHNHPWYSASRAGGNLMRNRASVLRPLMPSPTPQSQRRFDIVVIGAGPAGLSFALALERTGLTVGIVERQRVEQIADPAFDGREIALTHASIDRLRMLGVWWKIPADEISPLRVARVLNGAVPQGLDLCHPTANADALARLVSNHVIRRALYERIEQARDIELLCGEHVASLRPDLRDIDVELSSGKRLRASLVVAADSRFSETARRWASPRACGISVAR